jgi:GTPase SAR1 family protein
LVYDISRRQSFRNAINLWLNQVREHADEKIVILLVGNKSDLEIKREVPMEEARGFAGSPSARRFMTADQGLMFMEASALDATNVNECFEGVVQGQTSSVL